MEKPDVVTMSAEEYAVEGTSVPYWWNIGQFHQVILPELWVWHINEDAVEMVPEDHPEERVS